jgi:hypothetical protein
MYATLPWGTGVCHTLNVGYNNPHHHITTSRCQLPDCHTCHMPLYSELSWTAVTPGAERHNTPSASGHRNNASLCLRAEHTRLSQPMHITLHSKSFWFSAQLYIQLNSVCAQGLKTEGIIPYTYLQPAQDAEYFSWSWKSLGKDIPPYYTSNNLSLRCNFALEVRRWQLKCTPKHNFHTRRN